MLLRVERRKEETVTVYPADVVLCEGILMFYAQEIRDMFQMKLFVDTDADTRLSRRGEPHTTSRCRDSNQHSHIVVSLLLWGLHSRSCLPQLVEHGINTAWVEGLIPTGKQGSNST